MTNYNHITKTNSDIIGFIGLGIMGKPMSKNLLKAGKNVVVFNRSKKSMEELMALGAKKANSAKEVAELSDIIITMLPDGHDVEEVILGPDGVLSGIKRGSVLIDMSSISPIVAKRIAAEVEGRGSDMLDAPVSGGEPGAVQGTLAIMVGGRKEAFERCLPILQTMGKSITFVGSSGSGQITKLANQIVVAINIEALSEALVFAAKLDVDPYIAYQAIRGGLAGSNVMDAKAPMIIDRNFKAGFKLKLHQKDLRNVISVASEYNIPLPFTSLVLQMISSLINDGMGEIDHSGIALFLENMSKIQIKRKVPEKQGEN